MGYRQRQQKKILADHQLQYSILQPGLGASLHQQSPKAGRWGVTLRPSVILPLSNQLAVLSTQIKVFTHDVAFVDFYYHNTAALQIDLDLQWITPRLICRSVSGFFLKGK